MSYSAPAELSVSSVDVRRYIIQQLVAAGADIVWLVGSRSRREKKVPRPDSDWDLMVMGNDLTDGPLPQPTTFGVYGEVQRAKKPPKGGIELYPVWKYSDANDI